MLVSLFGGYIMVDAKYITYYVGLFVRLLLCKVFAKYINQSVCLFENLFVYSIAPNVLYRW